MIKHGVLPLNVLVGLLYIATAALALLCLKMAAQPLRRFARKQRPKQAEQSQHPNWNKMAALSVLKKFTLLGGFFCKDKKYLLKEFLFVAAYGVACLGVNHVILWPLSLSLVLHLGLFFLFDVFLKKVEEKMRETSQNKVNAQQQEAAPRIEVEPQSLEIINDLPQAEGLASPPALKTRQPRNIVQIVTVGGICLMSLVMMLQTVMTLGNSVSNSGELNIISLLAIVAIDQFAVRIGVCAFFWTVCKVSKEVAKSRQEESSIANMICHEELVEFYIEEEKQRLRKALQMVHSPPRKKVASPSRVPKALLTEQRQTYLNLINLQPTSRDGDEKIQEIYLTTAQKDLFEAQNNSGSKSGFYTRRNRNWETREVSCFSGNKGTTIDFNEKKEQQRDLVILKHNPFNEIENLPSDEFFLQDSDVRRTKRKGVNRKRNKRNLKLTGNSPYLQYLPDMLKKVDQFKHNITPNEKDKEKMQKIL